MNYNFIEFDQLKVRQQFKSLIDVKIKRINTQFFSDFLILNSYHLL